MKEYLVLRVADHSDLYVDSDNFLPDNKAVDVKRGMISKDQYLFEKALNIMAGAGWELHSQLNPHSLKYTGEAVDGYIFMRDN